MVVKMDRQTSENLVNSLLALTRSRKLIWREDKFGDRDWPDTVYIAKQKKTEFIFWHTTGELEITRGGNETTIPAMELRHTIELQVNPERLKEQAYWLRHDRKQQCNAKRHILQDVS